jgi:TonB family protein
MKRLVAFAAIALFSGATAAHAGPAADAWIAETGATLQTAVDGAGLSDEGKVVKLRFKLGAGGPNAVQIAESSGSADFDAAAKTAARKARLSRPPAELAGRSVVFTLGDPSSGSSAADAR